MTIEYYRETVYDPGSSSPVNALSVIDWWTAKILANAAWTQADEFESGTTTWRVFKCSAAVSGLVSDFYVAIAWTSTSVYFVLAEQYEVATKTVNRFAPGIVTAARQNLNPDTSIDQEHTLAALFNNVVNGSLPMARGIGIGASADAFLWVSERALVIGNGTDCIVLGNMADTLLDPAVDSLILVNGDLSSTATSNPWSTYAFSVTRHPYLPQPMPATSSYYFTYAIASPGYVLGAQGDRYVYPSWRALFGNTAWDKFWADAPVMGEIAFVHSGVFYSASVAGPALGALRGKWRDLRALPRPSGSVVGDTITAGGTKWALITSSGLWLDTKQAA